MRESLEAMVARLNAGGYLPPLSIGDVVMPKAVKLKKGEEFVFASGGGQPTKYPWDSWFNGDLLMLEKSVVGEDGKTVTEARDYDVDTDAMPPKIKTAARRRYKIVQVSKKDHTGAKLENALIIRARDMTAEERQAEDQLRAEEKAARKDKASEEDEAPAAPALAQTA